MRTRDYQDADYRFVSNWWALHNWPAVPRQYLPKTGVIVENDSGLPICAGFLYKTDSKLAWVEYIVSDPLSDTIERGQALDTLINAIIEMAKSMEFEALFTSSVHERLKARYQEHGFIATDTGVTHFVRNLWQSAVPQH